MNPQYLLWAIFHFVCQRATNQVKMAHDFNLLKSTIKCICHWLEPIKMRYKAIIKYWTVVLPFIEFLPSIWHHRMDQSYRLDWLLFVVGWFPGIYQITSTVRAVSIEIEPNFYCIWYFVFAVLYFVFVNNFFWLFSCFCFYPVTVDFHFFHTNHFSMAL